MARRILAMLLLLFTTPAFAQTFIGNTDGSTPLVLPIPVGPGSFKLNFWFSRSTPLQIAIHSIEYYKTLDLITGEYSYESYGGGSLINFGHPVQFGTFAWNIQRPYAYQDQFYKTEASEKGVDATLYFDVGDETFSLAPSDLSYTVTISSVPEPTQWALLIGGFGLAGAALRRRRHPAKFAIAA